jgi:hypothetical protein
MKEASICFAVNYSYKSQLSEIMTWRQKISSDPAMVLEVAKGLRGGNHPWVVRGTIVHSGHEVPDTDTLDELVRARRSARDATSFGEYSVGKQQLRRMWKRRVTTTSSGSQRSPDPAH